VKFKDDRPVTVASNVYVHKEGSDELNNTTEKQGNAANFPVTIKKNLQTLSLTLQHNFMNIGTLQTTDMCDV
jgi:hypothetical protein